MKRFLFMSLALASAWAVSPKARAELISFTFTGIVTDTIPLLFDVPVGSPMTGIFTIDTAVRDPDDPATYIFGLAGPLFTGTSAGVILGFGDQGLSTTGPSGYRDGLLDLDFTSSFIDYGGTPHEGGQNSIVQFTSSSNDPLHPVFQAGTFDFTVQGNFTPPPDEVLVPGGDITGRLLSFSRVPDNGSSATFLAVGLIAVVLLRRIMMPTLYWSGSVTRTRRA